MKVSTTWLKKSLRRTMSDRQLADALELAGIEVEQLISSKAIDSKIVVGLVKKCIQHPNADRLHLTEISIPGKTLSIVCGAPNVRTGLKVAVAQVGATLPSGDVITQAMTTKACLSSIPTPLSAPSCAIFIRLMASSTLQRPLIAMICSVWLVWPVKWQLWARMN